MMNVQPSDALVPDSAAAKTCSLADAIARRRSVRGFLPESVPGDTLREIFTLAQQAPSNCNVQPWHVIVGSGTTLRSLRDKLVNTVVSGEQPTLDFARTEQFEGIMRKRQIETAVELYGNMNIARGDKEGRARAALRNYEFFDAPHAAFIFMPKHFGETVALDVGMYAQTLMLALTAYGIGSCAQVSISRYPNVVREHFQVDAALGLLMAISFGYEDTSVPANKTRVPRAPIDEEVRFVS